MIPCKHCSIPNSLDSTFCKRCGTSLPEADIAEAREKLEAVVAQGVHALNEGRVEEAMAVADSATLSDPSSVAAWSLKANAHERRGEVAEALECAEKIVDLNPDSELDRIKRNQLRSALVLQARPVKTDRRFAIVGSVAAMVLVLCLGALAARGFGKPEDAGAVAFRDSGTKLNDPVVTPVATQSQTQPPVTPGARPETTGESPASQPAVTEPTQREPVLPPATTRLPTALGGQDGSDAVIKPLPVGPIPAPDPRTGEPKPNDGKQVKDPSIDPPPVAEKTPGTGTPDPDPVDTGEYSITVRGGARKNSGGSSSVTPAGSARMFGEIGTQQFQIGNFSAAATQFERAIQSGGDPVSLNQRLALSYDRLGRKTDAAAAYERAIRACDESIAAGRGDRRRLESVKDACESALKIVRGG